MSPRAVDSVADARATNDPKLPALCAERDSAGVEATPASQADVQQPTATTQPDPLQKKEHFSQDSLDVLQVLLEALLVVELKEVLRAMHAHAGHLQQGRQCC